MPRRTLLVVAGAVVAGLAVHQLRPDDRAPPVRPAPRVERARPPAARLSSPEGIRVDVAELAPTAAVAERLTPEDERARDDRRIAAKAALLAKAFAGDARDPAWSPQAEHALRARFATTELAGARLDEAACGATLCRVAVTFDTIAHRDEAYTGVVELVTWGSRGFGDVSADDPLRYVYYASRDPRTFPRVD